MSWNILQSGINCVQLVGSMSIPARDAAIKRFTEDPDCKIFLMSLKAGGVALNLTVASHVSKLLLFFILFISYNFHLKGQANSWLPILDDKSC